MNCFVVVNDDNRSALKDSLSRYNWIMLKRQVHLPLRPTPNERPGREATLGT